MKVVLKKKILILSGLLCCALTFGQPPPPGEADPPVLPIDASVFVLFGVAVIFGIYAIYKYNVKQKTSV